MEETTPTRSRLFRAGTVLIVTFSLVCGFLNLRVFYLFALPLIPVFIGLVLVWISSEPAKNKLLLSILTGPAMATGFMLFFWSLPKAEPETFLLPDSYRGMFTVLFVDGCGPPIPYENARRIYKIPSDGVLLHSGRQTEGVIDRRFVLTGSDGSVTELPEFDYSSFDDEANSLKWIFSRDELTKETVGVFWGYRSDLSFVISNFKDMEKLTNSEREADRNQLRQKIDSELHNKNCRR